MPFYHREHGPEEPWHVVRGTYVADGVRLHVLPVLGAEFARIRGQIIEGQVERPRIAALLVLSIQVLRDRFRCALPEPNPTRALGGSWRERSHRCRANDRTT